MSAIDDWSATGRPYLSAELRARVSLVHDELKTVQYRRAFNDCLVAAYNRSVERGGSGSDTDEEVWLAALDAYRALIKHFPD